MKYWKVCEIIYQSSLLLFARNTTVSLNTSLLCVWLLLLLLLEWMLLRWLSLGFAFQWQGLIAAAQLSSCSRSWAQGGCAFLFIRLLCKEARDRALAAKALAFFRG